MSEPIYLDYNATTPVDPRVIEAMLPYLGTHYGNPSSDHVYGRAAKAAVDQARAEVAALIGAQPAEIVFTGCATEANNLALQGAARALLSGSRRTLLYSAVEHPSVTQPMRQLANAGWTVAEIPVDASAQVDADALEIGGDVALVSVMLANNEVGTIQPIRAIAERARAAGALLHVDAAQAVGKIAVNVDELGCDLLTLAGHKFYAPKGVGALYVRAGTALIPIMQGAGHERGLRPGTENVPHLVALGTAARLAREEGARESARIQSLRDALHSRLAGAIPGLMLNGDAEARLPNTLNLSFPGMTGWDLLAASPMLAASTGSACHAGDHAVSGVLAAMGLTAERAAGAVRLSLGRFTTEAEIGSVAEALIAAWARAR
ncbi:MAG: cysteine desulfurase family protein [Thiobacillus sp.]|nr:cysteine desulfurase family protein [Thiobacillus sp.]